MEGIVLLMNISSNQRVGLVAFSDEAFIEFDLDDHNTSDALRDKISRVPYGGGARNTLTALYKARHMLDSANGLGARPESSGLRKVSILVTGKY